MPLLEDVFAEIHAVQSWQDRARRAEAGAQLFTPRQAAQMSLAARMYPDLRAGALLAIGKGNYRADHPVVQQLGELSAALQLRDHPYGAAYGEPAVSPAMRRGQSEARREANRAMAMASLPGSLPGWLVDAPAEVKAVWRTAVDAGITDNGLLVDRDRNVRSPQFFAFRDTLNKLTAAGVKVPFIREWGNDPAVFLATGSDKANNQGIRADYERLTEKPDRDTGGGPGFVESFARMTGTEAPQGPGAVQAAGLTDLALATPVRSAFMAADAPVQELQGQVRNLYAASHGEPVNWWEPQSDLGVQLQTGLDAGSGFFVDPESEVAQERRRREAERGQIGGHNVTLGRWVTDGLTPFDPDSRPAMILSGAVDFGVQLADPTAFAAGRLGAAQETRRLFAAPQAADEAAGVVRGLRWMVRPQSAQHWLDSEDGISALERFATERSPYTIWRNSGRKLPIRVARDLADTRTADDVRRVLEPELGTSIREVATVQATRNRPLGVMPARGRIDAHDPDVVAFEVEATLRNAHAPDDVIREAVDRVARADSPIKLNAAIRRAIDDDLNGILKLSGVEDEAVRSNLTRLHQNAHEESSDTLIEAITHQGPTDNPLMVANEQLVYPGAQLIVEHAPRYMTLPDARAIRGLTSRFPNVLGHNVFVHADGTSRHPVALLQWAQNEIWKPFALMRFAWTARVIGEEQIRMAAAGYDSMFKHPLSFLAWRTGRRGATDVAGRMLDEANEFKGALSQAHGGWVDRAMSPSHKKTTFYKGNVHQRERFNEAWGSELIRLSSDPVAQRVARSESLDDAYEWFTRGGGNRFRGDLAAAHPGRFDTEEAARAYIDLVQRRIDVSTGGRADLLDAVRTGKFDGEDMLTGTGQNANLRSKLDSLHDEFAPNAMVGEEEVPRRWRNRWDSAVDRMFGFLMTNRTNNLSRSPTFKQEYWRETERLIGFATEDTKRAIIEAAEKAGVSRRALNRMQRARARGVAEINDVDLWAKGHALDRTKELLYDMTRRGRFMDAARLVFPFGEAWSEVLKEWFHPRTGLASPLTGRGIRNIRRFQQTVQGARGEDFGELMGAPEGERGSLGFFWKNEFGEEVFVYPGSSFLTDKLLGVPIPLTGRVQGLSMFGTVVPGLGPAMQIPTGWFLQNKPGPQWFKEALGDIEAAEVGPLGTVREQLLPFGSPGMEDQGEIASVLNFVPPWMRTAFDFVTNGDGNEQAWANSVMSVAAYLRSTGRYGNSRADQQQLMEDASHKARWFHLIKAVGASGLPASPAPEWQVLDKNDRLVRLRALAEEYRELQADDYASADQEFLDRYGAEVLAAVQPKTAGIEYAVPVTREGAQWVLENPSVKGDLPHTYGFFAPQGGEFDYSLYASQFENNERVQLDPETWIRLMNATKANLILEDAKEQLGDDIDTEDGRAHLREVRAWLHEKYPGWDDSSSLPQRPSTATMIRELQQAVTDETVRSTDAGQGLALYLEGRQSIVDYQETLGLSGRDGVLSTSEQLADARVYLQQLAEWVIERHPDFKLVFDIVLSREVDVDDA